MKYPHDLHRWISPKGVVAPGIHSVSDALVVPPGYWLRGSRGERPAIRGLDTSQPTIELEGSCSNLDILGGRIGVNVRNGVVDAELIDVEIRGSALIGLWIGKSTRTHIARTIVGSCFDNGVQLEGPTDCEMHSCAIVGKFGNKAIDSTHGDPKGTRLVHLTVIADKGYGVGLEGWKPGRGNSMQNCAVFARDPGAGANGYAVLVPYGMSAGYFAGNVVQGRIGGTTEKPAQAQFDTQGWLSLDLPTWVMTSANMVERLRPAKNARMWSASLRTSFTEDLEGRVRVPWRMALAVGAVRG